MAFSERTFELMEGIAASGRFAYWQEHEPEFRSEVEEPFMRLFKDVVSRLPASVAAVMKVDGNRRDHFSQFMKVPSRVQQGAAHSHFWGAIYVGARRKEGVQLFLQIFKDRFDAGFLISSGAPDSYRDCLLGSLARDDGRLHALLDQSLSDESLRFGSQEQWGTPPQSRWKSWWASPSDFDIRVARTFTDRQVLDLSWEELASQCAAVFAALFPLVLLATRDDSLEEVRRYLGGESLQPEPVITLETVAAETGVELAKLKRWVAAIRRKGQAILFGPPGTGKTFLARYLAPHLVGDSDGFWELVQFHPAYSYEDFVQGLRPEVREDGGLDYPVKKGRFREFCERAEEVAPSPCVLIIDEINRANLARVFGELMYLLEYRTETIRLAGGAEVFGIPSNVILLGTMNTADRSIAIVDFALRRRFAFLELHPDYDHLRRMLAGVDFPVDGLIELLKEINLEIRDPHYALGTSFFLQEDLPTTFEDVWQTEIHPYLAEWFLEKPNVAQRYALEQVVARLGI